MNIEGPMQCRFCHCTDGKACVYTIAGVKCACYWIADNICSAPACIRAAEKLERTREVSDDEIRRLFGDVA